MFTIYLFTIKERIKIFRSTIFNLLYTSLSFLVSIEVLHFFSKVNNLSNNSLTLFKIFLSTCFVVWFFKRIILLKLISLKILKIKFRFYSLLTKGFLELFVIALGFTVQKLIQFYKEQPFLLFVTLVIHSLFVKNILLLSIFWLHWMYDSILDLEYLKSFKEIREQDIRSFNYHWHYDRDLVLLNKFLILVYVLSLMITYFSYFFCTLV